MGRLSMERGKNHAKGKNIMHQIKAMLEDIKKTAGHIPGLIKRVEYLETYSKTRKWASLPGVEDSGFSFLRAFKAIRSGDWSEAGVEREVFENTRKKAMGTADDVSGGYLVPSQAMPDLIEMLLTEAVVIESGARVITDLKGSPVTFPKQTGGASVYWVGDNAAITPSDLSFGQVKLTPKKAAALVQLSNSLLNQSSPQAEAVIRNDLARGIGLAVDLAALRGPGTENHLLGVANTPGINTVTWGTGGNGAVLDNSLDLFEDMVYELAVDNALRGKLGFIFHHAVRRALRKAKIPQFSEDAGGYPLIPAMIMASMRGDGALSEALGYPFRVTSEIPVSEVYFGNWEDLLIGMWGGMTILASDVAGNAFATDQTWIRVILNVDVALRHTESFCLCNDLAIS
jgi:HK97 family phage major capsid protein